MNRSSRPARIVILGGGFGGIAVAQRLERRLRPGEGELTLISRENFSLFTPILPEVSSGESRYPSRRYADPPATPSHAIYLSSTCA